MKKRTGILISTTTALSMLLSFSLIGSANAGNSNELRLHGNSTNKPAIDAIIKKLGGYAPYRDSDYPVVETQKEAG